MNWRKTLTILLIFFSTPFLYGESSSEKATAVEEKKLAMEFVPALNIDVEMSPQAQKLLSRYKENIIIMAKYEGLRSNGQFAGPEPPKVLSQTVSKKGGKAHFNSFNLLDFDETPLHFGGIMIQAVNTQRNTRQLLVKCSSFSLYPKKANVLQERFKTSVPISCRASNE